MLFAIKIVCVGFLYGNARFLPALGIPVRLPDIAISCGGARRVGEKVERMAIENVELDGVVAAADRIGKAMSNGDIEVRCPRNPVGGLGNFQTAILRQQYRHPHAAA